MSRLIHYSKSPLTELRPISFDVRPNGKPIGLWISVEGEDDWKSWCEGEDFNTESLTHAHHIILRSDANILWLTNSFEIDLFTEQYGIASWYGSRKDIDWKKLATEYQGIIIAPYIWQRRLSEHTFWYYGWDCASGCIWDVNAIESLELIEGMEKA